MKPSIVKPEIFINQPAGIGDIMFLEPIFRMLSKTHTVTVPIVDSFKWIEKHISYVNFVPYRCQFDNYDQEFTDKYLPLRFASPIYRKYDLHDFSDYENCMLDKYRVLDLPEEMWMDMELIRDYSNENKLFEFLGSPKSFILVNENSRVGDIRINIESNMRIIYMRPIEGFTLVDWCVMMERANENHHVSTSTFYLLNMLDVDATIYPRPSEDGLRGVSQMLPMTRFNSF